MDFSLGGINRWGLAIKALQKKEDAKRLENGEVFQMKKVRQIFSHRWMSYFSWETPKSQWLQGWNPAYCALDVANQWTLLNFVHSRMGWAHSMSLQFGAWVKRGYRVLPDGKCQLLDENHKKTCIQLALDIPRNTYCSLIKGLGVAAPFLVSSHNKFGPIIFSP